MAGGTMAGATIYYDDPGGMCETIALYTPVPPIVVCQIVWGDSESL